MCKMSMKYFMFRNFDSRNHFYQIITKVHQRIFETMKVSQIKFETNGTKKVIYATIKKSSFIPYDNLGTTSLWRTYELSEKHKQIHDLNIFTDLKLTHPKRQNYNSPYIIFAFLSSPLGKHTPRWTKTKASQHWIFVTQHQTQHCRNTSTQRVANDSEFEACIFLWHHCFI